MIHIDPYSSYWLFHYNTYKYKVGFDDDTGYIVTFIKNYKDQAIRNRVDTVLL